MNYLGDIQGVEIPESIHASPPTGTEEKPVVALAVAQPVEVKNKTWEEKSRLGKSEIPHFIYTKKYRIKHNKPINLFVLKKDFFYDNEEGDSTGRCFQIQLVDKTKIDEYLLTGSVEDFNHTSKLCFSELTNKALSFMPSSTQVDKVTTLLCDSKFIANQKQA